MIVPIKKSTLSLVINDRLKARIQRNDKNKERCEKWCNLTGSQAYLCKKCGYGKKRTDLCPVCDKPTGVLQFRAQLCMDHGYGDMNLNCCRCGRYCGSAKIVAHLCAGCGNGHKEDFCCKMEPKQQ